MLGTCAIEDLSVKQASRVQMCCAEANGSQFWLAGLGNTAVFENNCPQASGRRTSDRLQLMLMMLARLALPAEQIAPDAFLAVASATVKTSCS